MTYRLLEQELQKEKLKDNVNSHLFLNKQMKLSLIFKVVLNVIPTEFPPKDAFKKKEYSEVLKKMQ